jgi:hypothetical protein
MSRTIIKFIVLCVKLALRQGQLAMISLAADRRCARQLDQLAERLALIGVRINLMRANMAGGAPGDPIDADHALRDALGALKHELRDMRWQFSQIQGGSDKARLQRAFGQLGNVAETTYARADQLQWEIDAHDRD